MSTRVCRVCGAALGGHSARCSSCDSAIGSGIDATGQVTATRSPLELVVAQRADQLRQRLALAPGESGLLLTRGPGAGSKVSLGNEVVTLGRHARATVLLDDVSVSRRHAEIRPEPDGYRIVDVGSLNGTYVNQVRVAEVRLNDGDDIQIGLFKLYFVSKAAAPPAPRPRLPERR